MTVRVRYKFIPTISSDSNELKDLGSGNYDVVSDLLTDGGSWKFTVAAGVTNLQIPLPGITTATYLAIRTTPKDASMTPNAVVIKRNNTSGEAISIDPFGGKEGLLVLTTSALTALYATNAGTVDMELTVFAAGN